MVCFAKQMPRSKFVVVKTVTACAASERGYAASLATRTVRWLADGGVKADLVDDRALDSALLGRRLAYIVVCQKPTAAQMQSFARFRARGGKLAVLQSYSPELAGFMGVSLQKHVLPRSVPPKVTTVQCGWWSANIFGSDATEDVKARVLLDMAGRTVPGSWSAAKWDSKKKVLAMVERDYGKMQKPRAGEIHAVWDHTGQGLYPGNWARTMRILKANGVTDLFVNVAGAGFAHYPSSVLAQSQVAVTYGDQLSACLAASRGTGIRVHAWVLCFTAARSSAAQKASLAKRGWRIRDKGARLTEYLDPSNPQLRWHLISAIDDLVRRYPVAGVHLDFVRYYEQAKAKPANAAAVVTSFVEAVRKRMKSARSHMWLTAAVMSGLPSCATSVGQNWGTWLDRNLIDYAVPMNYFEDNKKLSAALSRQTETRARARRIISGVGVTANESVLTPMQVVDQVNAARRAGVAGVALFDLDSTLVERVLPVLRLGLFR